MKHTLFTLLLLCAGLLPAQEFSYTITSEAGDSTFTLDVVTENATNRFDIDRTTGLDTAALQAIQYARIERLRQEQARKETEILASQREINALNASLNSLGLNDYLASQITKLDSFYVNEAGWRLVNTDGLSIDLSTFYREGNTTVLRDTSNANYAAIVPFASNFIQINFLGVDPPDTNVQLFSRDGRLYRGQSASGKFYVFRKK